MKYLILLLLLSGCGTQTLVKNCKKIEESHYAACEKLGFWE